MNRQMNRRTFSIAGVSVLLATARLGLITAAHAEPGEIVIGMNVSLTGEAATLGVPQKNALDFVPKEIGGIPLKVIVLDDGTDRWNAGTNANKLATEAKVDVLIGSSTAAATLALALVASEYKIPHIGLAPMSISPARQRWSIVVAQPTSLMAKALYDHMLANKIKTVGYFGYNDPYGDLWFNDLDANSEDIGVRIVEEQRFGRADTSVTGHALQLVAAKPDAILIGASGRVVAMPDVALRKNGYNGAIYLTQGAAGPEFLAAAGAAAEGAIMVAPPLMDAENLPDESPVKKVAIEFAKAYEAKYGPATRNVSASHTYDAFEILKRVIPVALKSAKPGTPEFRDAIRRAILTEKEIPGSGGVYTFTETDRYGQDNQSRILMTVKGGKFVSLK